MRPPRRTRALLLLTLVPILAGGGTRSGPTPDRPIGARLPNILLIIGDDHAGGTLGVDGDPRHATPRLDAMAARGVRFARAYCNAPLCSASRGSFLTGRLPHAVGVTRLNTPLPATSRTLGDRLGELGYDTAAVGKMHFNDRHAHGFAGRVDRVDWLRSLGEKAKTLPPFRPMVDPARLWLNADRRDAGLVDSEMESTYFADRAADFLRDRKGRSDPFLLVLSFYDPHAPFRFPKDAARRFRPDEFEAPPIMDLDHRDRPAIFEALTDADTRGVQAAYYSAIAHVDTQVGRVLDALDASGMAEETIVVYLGDNGYLRGDHGRFEKHCLLEPAVRVPLIVRWPGHLPAGRSVDAMVELVDLVPTLLDLAKIAIPDGLHGRSLAPLLRDDPGASGRDVVVSTYADNEEGMARSDRYKLIVGTGRRRREDGYVASTPRTEPYEHLYDEGADPGEVVDRIADPTLSSIADDLRHRLFDRLTSTREGIEPVPAGLSEIEAIRWCLAPRDRH